MKLTQKKKKTGPTKKKIHPTDLLIRINLLPPLEYFEEQFLIFLYLFLSWVLQSERIMGR